MAVDCSLDIRLLRNRRRVKHMAKMMKSMDKSKNDPGMDKNGIAKKKMAMAAAKKKMMPKKGK